MNNEERISHILNNLLSLASGNFDISDLPEVKNDSIDAIDRGIFMLGEELKANHLKQKQLILEKEALLKEVHHRVKNNLQIVTSLLNIQSNDFDDTRVKEIFINSQNRINSMAMVHEMLYKTGDFKKINYNTYSNILIQNLVQSGRNELKVEIEVSDIFLNINTAIPLGLIINEIVMNSIKHGFNSDDEGTISLKIKSIGNSNFMMKLGDNGRGDVNVLNTLSRASLGLSLIDILIDQLNGSISMDNSKKGINYIIKFQKLD